jgi:hypothetical protein
MAYVARISDKQGRCLYRSTQLFESRDEAAADAFNARPKARDCSTSRGVYVNGRGVVDYHNDIRWHTKERTP